MANLTLGVDDGILQKAREAAVRDHPSVNALVREYLIRYVDAKSRRLALLREKIHELRHPSCRSELAPAA